jgi:hypothetical protein
MKNTKKSIALRYEFSNETGLLEGGDIFEFPSVAYAIKMTSDILKVAAQDGVAVHITVGEPKPFHGLLKNYGMTDAQIAAERVPAPTAKTATPKTKKKTAAKKKKK